MATRTSLKFDELALQHRKALIAYVMAGYPDIRSSISAAEGLIQGGADVIELGFPFSDPLADGPVIQNAASISLQNRISIGDYFDIARHIRSKTDMPLITMTYTNILLQAGFSDFVARASSAGIDGLILPDMPIEESAEYAEHARLHDMDTIFLASPNTSQARIRKIVRHTRGFLYLVAVYGTTGTQSEIQDYTIRAIRAVKKTTGRRIPLCVGFGISGYNDARRYIKAGADGVIVGSAILRTIQKSPRTQIKSRVAKFTRDIRRATLP